MEVAPRSMHAAHRRGHYDRDPDTHTEVHYEYGGARGRHGGGHHPRQPTLAGSCGGMVFGIVLLFGATLLLWTNEGVAVKTQKTLDEASHALRVGEGGLSHHTGMLETSRLLTDHEWGVEAPSMTLDRVVEVYQWREHKDEKRVKVGDATRVETTYRYTSEWQGSEISSSRFKKPQGHHNPSWSEAVGAAREHAGGAGFDAWSDAAAPTLDGLRLAAALARKAERLSALPLSTPGGGRREELRERLSATRARVVGDYVYSPAAACAPPEQPTVGCARLSWRHAPLVSVSVLAGTIAGELVPWRSRAGGAGYELGLVEVGPPTPAADMLEAAAAENALWTWIKRGGGVLLTWAGYALLFGPAQYLASWVPLLGGLVGCLLSLVALGVALAHSISVIALAWLAQRPLAAASLLAIVAGALYMGVGALRSMRAKGPTSSATPSSSQTQYKDVD